MADDKNSNEQSRSDNVEVTYMDNKGNSNTIFDSDGGGKHGDHGHAIVDSQGNTVHVRGQGERKG